MRNLVAVGVVVTVSAFTVACGGGGADEKTATTDQSMMCLNCGDGTSSGGIGGGGGGGYTPVPPHTHIGTCIDPVSGASAGDFTAATQGNYWAIRSVDPTRWAHDDYVTTTKGWASPSDLPYFIANNSTGGAWYGLQVSRNVATAAKTDAVSGGFNVYATDPVVQAHVVTCSVTDSDTGVTTTTYWLVDDPNCNNGCSASHAS
jgi:hypothetical protein